MRLDISTNGSRHEFFRVVEGASVYSCLSDQTLNALVLHSAGFHLLSLIVFPAHAEPTQPTVLFVTTRTSGGMGDGRFSTRQSSTDFVHAFSSAVWLLERIRKIVGGE